MANNTSNQLVVPGAEQALNQMKYEIAQEFGVQLGPDATSRSNGSVGGEITKRLGIDGTTTNAWLIYNKKRYFTSYVE